MRWQLVAISVAPPLPGRRTVGAPYGPMTVLFRLAKRSICAPPRNPTVIRPPCSQYLEHLRDRHGGERRFAQLAVADRQRQNRRLGFERAGLVDEREARRVRETREVAGGRRQADADEADVVVAERARGGHGHHFRGGVAGHGAPVRAANARSRKSSGRPLMTCSSIQAAKRSRSRAIASHAT